MKIKFFSGLILLILVISVFSCTTEIVEKESYKKFYEEYDVNGIFVLYDQKRDKYVYYNKKESNTKFTPASTFKICNSLIGVETGVIKDENYVIKWDSITRSISSWNKDQTLKSAFKNSAVWYYQVLARRVGGDKMKYWLDESNYGNKDTSGGIDVFWLDGGLRISPEQQIDFLKRLHDNNLPFSQRTMDIVKKIMIVKDSAGFVVRAKTGWGIQDSVNIGWYVGYVETENNVYYFANCIQEPDADNQNFLKARIDITYKILNDLKVFEKN